ncbi:PQQ-dependent dehydrogenase, methanol/ethanol family [Acetobacter orleanensis]|uniref:Alcohol dehydrogenase n=1 Tax=Acetobacter orleanensis TaxID=104099 RepID=A0A4Y3TQ44_9PROT|nr:PQQ-dependent dehydrogenase, methanol/ethanol family [Acetobacter orleanensis]PCD78619.1 PQQ-dependent dehydrogenase, methanol/ethanol family [Acetobacter orleanensis]GAN67320.1 alcohol dehydrogenase PQQ-dependent, large subunit [Acetobacter orleanensis JCM 7639]GBR23812.1 alcohol dehydrogenase large subunit [Acetobacter orleanensis NRIC 0473]GEB83579.1 alcohol dehydrogenase [Acetobacter orleanensis]
MRRPLSFSAWRRLSGLGTTLALCAGTSVAVAQPTAPSSDWPLHGLTTSEQRFSTLDQINTQTVSRLGLAWYQNLDALRGQEGTPLVIGGIMYATTSWSRVEALKADTGEVLWQYDPRVPGNAAVRGCCDTANRGAAYSDGRIFIGTYDGRLQALDAKTGHLLWSVNTIPENATLGGIRSYTITGAPRIAKGIVIIGNGGSEFGARGFVSGFDEKTGALKWRFYTVPAPGNKPDNAASDKVLHEKVYKTWSPNGGWVQSGGGGTVWDSIVYDPETDLVYLGVGNGSPWSYSIRSNGIGDNLFLGSIVAIRPETGEYVWHFQETPMDQWDFTASQPMMILDLTIHGQKRHLLAQAPKNGFFYLLDAATGEFISATPYTFLNWADGVDPKTGRPNIVPDALWSLTGKTWMGIPGSLGGHNWAPMAYSPKTGYIYIPAQQMPQPFHSGKNFKLNKMGVNLGIDMTGLPDDQKVVDAVNSGLKGWLEAWDPVAGKVAFTVPHATPWNGGVLATAGNLIFQGLATGGFEAYDASNGKRLYHFDAHSGIIAPPITYSVNGRQYVAVEVGWGGIFPLMGGAMARYHNAGINHSRLLVFALDGEQRLPLETRTGQIPIPTTQTFNPKQAQQGYTYYQNFCMACHGDNAIAGGVLPDLRSSGALSSRGGFQAVVSRGVLENFGMVGFSKVLTPQEIEDIRQFLIRQSSLQKRY